MYYPCHPDPFAKVTTNIFQSNHSCALPLEQYRREHQTNASDLRWVTARPEALQLPFYVYLTDRLLLLLRS